MYLFRRLCGDLEVIEHLGRGKSVPHLLGERGFLPAQLPDGLCEAIQVVLREVDVVPEMPGDESPRLLPRLQRCDHFGVPAFSIAEELFVSFDVVLEHRVTSLPLGLRG